MHPTLRNLYLAVIRKSWAMIVFLGGMTIGAEFTGSRVVAGASNPPMYTFKTVLGSNPPVKLLNSSVHLAIFRAPTPAESAIGIWLMPLVNIDFSCDLAD